MEIYQKPSIEVLEVEIEGAILDGSILPISDNPVDPGRPGCY